MMSEFGDTAPKLHNKLMGLLRHEKGGRLLDIPSGEGRLSYFLNKAGFEVIAADIDSEVFKISGVDFLKCDMNNILPFRDNSFDHVLCVEGLEHLENTFHLFRELSRILKSGGKLFLSTPNILSVQSRIRYLSIGHHAFFRGYYANRDNFYTYHINPAGFPQILTALEKAGLHLDRLDMNRIAPAFLSLGGNIILRLFAMFIRKMTYLKEKDEYLRQFLLSPELLFGEILIIVCSKIGTKY